MDINKRKLLFAMAYIKRKSCAGAMAYLYSKGVADFHIKSKPCSICPFKGFNMRADSFINCNLYLSNLIELESRMEKEEPIIYFECVLLLL